RPASRAPLSGIAPNITARSRNWPRLSTRRLSNGRYGSATDHDRRPRARRYRRARFRFSRADAERQDQKTSFFVGNEKECAARQRRVGDRQGKQGSPEKSLRRAHQNRKQEQGSAKGEKARHARTKA